MESRYRQVYAEWRRDPQAFWRDAARAIDWIRPPYGSSTLMQVLTGAGSPTRVSTPVSTRSTVTFWAVAAISRL